MSAIPFIDGNGQLKHVDAAGSGTSVDPYVPIQRIAANSEPQPVVFQQAQEVKFGGTAWQSHVFFGVGTPNLILKNSPGFLMAFYCYNRLGSNQFLQFFNAVTVPGSNQTPVDSFLIKPNSTERIGSEFFGQGREFSLGIVIGFSSTENGYTPSDYTKITWSVRTR